MKFLYLVVALLIAIGGIFVWGMSQSRAAGIECGEKSVVLKTAMDSYHEAPVFDGTTIGGDPVLMVMSPNGTWTLFLVRGTQLCGVAAGKLTATVPDIKPKTSAPMLLPNGLRMIRG